MPAGYVGGTLCWRGTVMWEGENERFTRWPGEGCRAIEAADAGRRVFGMAIKPDTLAMRIDATVDQSGRGSFWSALSHSPVLQALS